MTSSNSFSSDWLKRQLISIYKNRVGGWAIAAAASLVVVLIVTHYLVRFERCYTDEGRGSWRLVNIAKIRSRISVGSEVVVKVNGEKFGRIVRTMGLPGDTIALTAGCALINGSFADDNINVKSTFYITKDLSYKFRNRMARDAGYALPDSVQTIVLPIAKRLESWQHYTYPPEAANFPSKDIYPFDLETHNNAYNIHRIALPRAGEKITMTEHNLLIYKYIINKYEDVPLPHIGEEFRFEHSYFWFLNDNRDIFSDSRTYGPIPEYLILGTIL